MSLIERLEEAVDKAENASGIMHDFVTADDESDVETDSGLLPSIRKWLKALRTEVLAKVAVLEATTVSGDAHTLVLADAGKVVEFNHAAPTLTLENNTFPVRAQASLLNLNGGAITVSAGDGITVRGPTSLDGETMHSIYRVSSTIYQIIGKAYEPEV